MKKIILLSFLLITNNIQAIGLNTYRNSVLSEKFQQLKSGEIKKPEFIDYVNNKLHHPLVDFYQDENGIYQWIVSNDKFLISRGISSIEEINIMKNQKEFKAKDLTSNITAISAFGAVNIDGEKSGLTMNVLKAGAAYSKTIEHKSIGFVNYQASALFSNYFNIKLDNFEGGSSLTTLIPEINLAASKRNGTFSYGLKYSYMQYFVLAAKDSETDAKLNLESVNRIAPITSYFFNDKVSISAAFGFISGPDIAGTDSSVGLSYTYRSNSHFGISYYLSNLEVLSQSENSNAIFGSYAYSF